MAEGPDKTEPPRPVERATGLADLPRTTRQTPLFLHRETYRRRRVMDAARILPFLGAALLLLPMLWAESHSTSMGAVYVFLAWLALIVAGALMANKLSEPLRKSGQTAEPETDS
ncbi:MAG: hypothetical protein AAGG09_15800 [Pseudomonadota bacterium]